MSQSDTATSGSAPHPPPPTDVRPAPAVAPAWRGTDYDFVTECWDQARRARLYELYFGHTVANIQALNLAMEVVVAVTAAGGAISGWALWKDPNLSWVWSSLVGIAAIVSIIKPIIRLDLKIERYSKLLSDYRALSLSYQALIFSIQQAEGIEDDHRDRQDKLAERMQRAREQWPPRMADKRVNSCQNKVNEEFPSAGLWAPPVPGKHPKHPL